MLSAEDGESDTIAPRLHAAGADCGRIYTVSAVYTDNGSGRRGFDLKLDLALLEKKIAEIGDVALVVIDPISSYLGKTDSHKNAEVRGVLEPLGDMAERTGVAVLSITHFSKAPNSTTTKALHKFIGSIAFVGTPRAAFTVIEDPNDRERRLLLHAKNNLAAPPQGLAFRLQQAIIGAAGKDIVASRVSWESEPVTMTANDAIAAEAEGKNSRTAGEDAGSFLRELLAFGPVSAKEIKAEAEAAGLAWATVRRAKDRLGIRPRREAAAGTGFGGDGRWVWELPKVFTCT